MEIIKLIFGFLCGCLYLIGQMFGWSYQETSVYVCIYAWPAICVAASAIGSIYFIRHYEESFVTKCLSVFNLGLTLFYISTTSLFWGHFGSFADPFEVCMDDLQHIARDLSMIYEEVNLYVYCVLFFGIVLFHLIQIFLHRIYRRFRHRSHLIETD